MLIVNLLDQVLESFASAADVGIRYFFDATHGVEDLQQRDRLFRNRIFLLNERDFVAAALKGGTCFILADLNRIADLRAKSELWVDAQSTQVTFHRSAPFKQVLDDLILRWRQLSKGALLWLVEFTPT